MILPTKSIQSVVANPRIKKPKAVPKRLASNTGRRPYLSDHRPSTGAKMNCIIE